MSPEVLAVTVRGLLTGTFYSVCAVIMLGGIFVIYKRDSKVVIPADPPSRNGGD